MFRGTRDQAMAHGLWAREEIDLSYLNVPDINALLLMADYRGLDAHTAWWTQLQPPEECLRLCFVTEGGRSIVDQVKDLTEVCLLQCSC